MRARLLTTLVACLAVLGLAALPATATSGSSGPSLASLGAADAGTVAVGIFDRTTDTSPQLVGGETSPRGTLVFTQAEDAADLNDVLVNGRVTGLAPRTAYVAVLYLDAVCLPTPSVTAFPSSPFTTDRRGRASLRDLLLNPQAINALRTFDVEATRSISIREVVLPGGLVDGLPVTTPTLPNAGETEGCDRSPFVN